MHKIGFYIYTPIVDYICKNPFLADKKQIVSQVIEKAYVFPTLGLVFAHVDLCPKTFSCTNLRNNFFETMRTLDIIPLVIVETTNVGMMNHMPGVKWVICLLCIAS